MTLRSQSNAEAIFKKRDADKASFVWKHPACKKTPLRVIISGGGPVGLLLANQLKELFGLNVSVAVFEGRWKQAGGEIVWKSEEDGNKRRSQVITLQSRPLAMLPPALKEALLPEGGYSEVWPHGKDSPFEYGRPWNIRIVDIEDRLLEYAKKQGVQLIPEWFNPGKTDLINCDILAICEGRRSQTLHHFKNEFGEADVSPYSLQGVQVEDKILGLKVKTTLKCPETVLFSIIQNRFLLNTNDNGYGYLNMRLSPEESEEFQHTTTLRATRLWPRILDGLKLFGIDENDLLAISCFSISMDHRSRFSTILHWAPSDHPTYGFLLGDTANAIHFWPGRGLNQGILSAMSLALCLKERWKIGKSLREADFSKHEGIMHMLQHRHKSRAWYAMTHRNGGNVQPISNSIAMGLKKKDIKRAELLDALLERSTQMLSRLKGRLPELPSPETIKKRLELLSDETLHVLVLSKAWDTQWSGGPEVDLAIFYPNHK